jgi:hypothetical protein
MLSLNQAFARLRKLKATINHRNTPEGERMAAQMAAGRIASKHGIDLDEVDDGLTTDDRSNFNICHLEGSGQSVRFEERTAAMLVGEFYDCEIRALSGLSGQRAKFIFLTPKPHEPQTAAQFFSRAVRELDGAWWEYQRFGGSILGKGACKQSFLSGLYWGLRERLKDERAPDNQTVARELLEGRPPKPRNGLKAAPAPEPNPPPPPETNPYALVHLPRLVKRKDEAKPKPVEQPVEPKPEPKPPVDMLSYSAGYARGIRSKLKRT